MSLGPGRSRSGKAADAEATPSTGPDAGLRAHLRVRAVRFDVHLGVAEDERAEPQPVEVEVRVGFPRPPRGVETDRVEDTVDYGRLVERMAETLAGREFRLVERLTGVLFQAVRTEVPPGATLELRVRKVDLPVAEIEGGAEFILADG